MAFRPATVLVAALLATAAAQAQDRTAAELPGVTVRSQAGQEPVEKSYRRMLRGLDLFEREHALAPQAQLRFRLYPRQPGVDLDRNVDLYLVGRTVEIPLPVAADRTFALPRDAKAWAENAQVTPDRQARTMTWRADVRTPGLPPGTRRLGDLRLECRVGMEAGLVSEPPSLVKRLFGPLENTPAYCERPDNRYLFFAERPIFGVTLVNGARRAAVPVRRLYAAALGDAGLAGELQACDCAVLLDRAYFMPLGDRSWPDDTRVEFEFMEDGDAPR